MPEPPAPASRPRLPLRAVAGAVSLLTSIGMFLLTGLGEVVWHQHVELSAPAWAFLSLAAYVLMGVSLHNLLIRGNEDERSDRH